MMLRIEHLRSEGVCAGCSSAVSSLAPPFSLFISTHPLDPTASHPTAIQRDGEGL
jgi:hypothetical protein